MVYCTHILIPPHRFGYLPPRQYVSIHCLIYLWNLFSVSRSSSLQRCVETLGPYLCSTTLCRQLFLRFYLGSCCYFAAEYLHSPDSTHDFTWLAWQSDSIWLFVKKNTDISMRYKCSVLQKKTSGRCVYLYPCAIFFELTKSLIHPSNPKQLNWITTQQQTNKLPSSQHN